MMEHFSGSIHLKREMWKKVKQNGRGYSPCVFCHLKLTVSGVMVVVSTITWTTGVETLVQGSRTSGSYMWPRKKWKNHRITLILFWFLWNHEYCALCQLIPWIYVNILKYRLKHKTSLEWQLSLYFYCHSCGFLWDLAAVFPLAESILKCK